MTDETRPDGGAPLYSVVIPVYRSEAILPTLVARLDAFFDEKGYRREYVMVNDGSPDRSWEVLEELARDRDDFIAIDLLRNYGQHSALFCGLKHASGDFAITMDDDLQNPPEEIEPLVQKAAEGYDVVFGEFERKMHGPVRNLGTKVVGWLNQRLFRKPPDLVLTNFRILNRDVIDGVCAFRTTFPYIPGLVLMSARTFANVTVRHDAREVGQSGYGVKTIAKLVWRLVFNYSAFPLRLLSGFGVITALLAFALAAFYLVNALVTGTSVPGWPTVVVLLAFFQGCVLIVLAAMGEYLVRLVNEVGGPMPFHVRRRV